MASPRLLTPLLGMRAEGHGDSKTEAHPWVHILIILLSGMKDATHTFAHFAGSSHPRWSPGIGGRPCRRSSPLRRAPNGEGAEAEVIGVPEVLLAVDVARWTCVASPFAGHENICKSQRIVMTS
jgi:hypothetical protein